MGRTALVWASKCSARVEVVQALLKAGARVNVQDTLGLTPLLYAVWMGTNPAIAAALLDAGANAAVKGPEGRTVMDYAESNPAIVKDEALLRRLEDAISAARVTAGRIQDPA